MKENGVSLKRTIECTARVKPPRLYLLLWIDPWVDIRSIARLLQGQETSRKLTLSRLGPHNETPKLQKSFPDKTKNCIRKVYELSCKIGMVASPDLFLSSQTSPSGLHLPYMSLWRHFNCIWLHLYTGWAENDFESFQGPWLHPGRCVKGTVQQKTPRLSHTLGLCEHIPCMGPLTFRLRDATNKRDVNF